MEINISPSVAMAIRFMFQLEQGKMTDLNQALIKPDWGGLMFFSKIKSPPTRLRRNENVSSGIWQMEREVDFYIDNICVARICMEGQRIECAHLEKQNDRWCISRVEYLTRLNGEQSDQETRSVELKCSPIDLLYCF